MTTSEMQYLAKRFVQISRKLESLALEHPHVSDVEFMRIREVGKRDRKIARALRKMAQ